MIPFLGGVKLFQSKIRAITNFFSAPTAPPRKPRRRRWQQLLVERLEDRSLLSVTPVVTGNTVTFTSDADDTVYLSSTAAGILEYNTDGSASYTSLGVNLLTAANSISSNTTIIIAGNLYTDGQTLYIHADAGIEVNSSIIVSTRNLANVFTGNHLTDPSTGNSGTLTFDVKNADPFDPIPFAINTAPHITVQSGGMLLAQATAGFTPGDVSLTVTNTNVSLDLLIYADIGVIVRDASIDLKSAIIQGNTVTIEATGGDIALANQLNQSIGDNAGWVNGLIHTATGYATDYTALPVSFMYKKGTAEVTLDSGSQITAAGDVTLSTAASADATGEAIYYRGTQLGASFGFNWAETSAVTQINANTTINALGNVSITSTATNTISGTARVTQNIGGGASTTSGTSNVEISGEVGASLLTSHATVAAGASITSGKGVTVDAEGTYFNVLAVQTASYYSGRAGITFYVGYTSSDVLAEVNGTINVTGATAAAPQASFNPFLSVDFASSVIHTDTTLLSTGDRLKYDSGIGAPIPGLQDGATYYAIVDVAGELKLAASVADARAGTAITFGVFPTLTRTNGTPITLPITDINQSNDTIEYQFATGLNDGDTVTYQAVAGQYIGGLVDGASYTVVNSASNPSTNSYTFQLQSGGIADLNQSPQMLIGGTPYDFDTDPSTATITFTSPPGSLANGTPMVFREALGRAILGIVDGQTYYAVINPYAPGEVRLANSAIDAAIAYQEGLTAYYQATQYYYLPAYQTYLAANPGDITGAEAAGNAAAAAAIASINDAQAIWFDAGTGSARKYPYLTTAGGTPLVISSIDTTNDEILFAAPLTGVANGDTLTFTAVAGININGLVDGTQYKAVFNASTPTVLKLTTLADVAVDLDSSPQLIRTGGEVLDFTVNSSGQIVFATPPIGLTTGEKLTYHQAMLLMNATQTDGTGGVYAGLVDGQDYYVILTGTSGTINLARSLANAMAGTAIQGIAFTGQDGSAPILINLAIGAPLMSGPTHTLTPPSSGITIEANLNATDTGSTSSQTGFTPTIGDALTKGEVLPAFGGILQNFLDLSPNATDTVEQKIVNNLPKDGNGNPVTTGPSWSATGAFGVQYVTNTVKAHVGGTAVLTSNQDISVTSTTTEDAQIAAESSVYQPDSASGAKSFAAGVVIGIYKNTVQTVIDDGATLHADETFTATSTLTYPFVFPLQTGASAAAFFESNPIGNLAGFLDGELGLDSMVFNTWVRSVAAGHEDSFDISGSVAVLDYINKSQTTIGAINLTAQSVDVEASTSMEFNRMAGVFDLFLTPEALIDYKRNGNKLAFYNPFGSDDAKGGIGGTVMVVVADNTTEATIGAATINGATDGVTVKATNDLLEIDLVQSGARAENFGFAGSVTVADITNTTTAQIGPGATITAASIDIDATDSTVLVNLAGSIEMGNHIGFGFTATVNKFSRDTQAILGAGAGQTAAPSNITLTGDLDINAKNSGALVSASFAAAITKKADDPQQAAANNNNANNPLNQANNVAQNNPIPNMVGNQNVGVGNGNNNAGNYGVAVSGDAAINLITLDNAYAYINDKHPTNLADKNLVAANVNVTASNTSSVGAFAGTVAAATIPDDNTNFALAGSFTLNTIHSDTQAYIAGMVLQADAITVDAKRTGQLVSITAGVAAAAGTSGVGLSGSVSVSEITHTILSYLSNTNAVLTGDTNVTAEDQSRIITVAGGVGYGGKAGVGVAVAVNLLTNTTKAYVDGSTINTTGLINITASNDNPSSDARIVALTGTVGVNTNETGGSGAGMASVNIITNTTQAYIADSTITVNGSDAITVYAVDKSWIISVGFAAGGGGNVGVGFAFGYNEIKDQSSTTPAVTAYIDSSSINSDGSLTVHAESDFVLGTASLSGAGAKTLALAGNASINLVEVTVDAHISDSPGMTPRIDVTGAIIVEAEDHSEIVAISGNVAISTNQVAGGASFSYNLIDNTTTAYIDDSAVETGSTLTVSATSSPLLVAVSISGDGGKNYAAGGAITVNRITNTTDAHISGKSTVTAASAIEVTATDSSSMYVVAIGASFAGTAEGGAGVAANAIGDISDANKRNVIKAYIDDSTVTSTNASVTVAAGFSDPGTFDLSSPVVIGNGMGADGDDPLEFDLPADKVAPNTGTTPTGTTMQIFNLSVGGGGAETFGFGGALSLNYIRNTVDAHISGNSTVNAATNVIVEAGDTSKIIAIAGAATLVIRGGQSGTTVSVGISVGVNNISNDVTATVDDASVHGAQGVLVSATPTTTILAITLAGAGAGSTQGGGIAVAAAGAGSGNTIANTASALIKNGSTVSSGAGFDVDVTAVATSSINAISGTLAIAAAQRVGVSIGAAAAVNSITNNTTASIDTATVHSGGNVDVTATSDDTVFALTLGIAGAVSAGSGGGIDFAGAGSGSGNTLSNTIEASIKNSDGSHSVTTSGTGSVNLKATDSNSKITAAAGAAAIAVSVGGTGASPAIGVSVASNHITNVVTAEIDSSVVTSVREVALTAGSNANILAVTVAGGVSVSTGGGIAFAGAGAGSGNTINNTVSALIQNGSHVTTPASQDVTLTVTDTSTISGDGGGVGIGFAGGQDAAAAGALGASAAVNTITNTAKTSIDNSTVNAGGDIILSTTSSPDIFSVTVGVQGAMAFSGDGSVSLAGAGSGSGNSITNVVEASIRNNSHVTTTNNGKISLTATDGSTITAGAGVLGVSIAGGDVLAASLSVGASKVVNDINNTVSAYIDKSTVTADGDLEVEATSTSTIKAITAGASVSVAAGDPEGSITAALAGVGASSTNHITSTIQAYIQNASTVQADAVTVSATDTPTITAHSGGGSLAVSVGSISASIGVAVILANNLVENTVQAFIGQTGGAVDTTTVTARTTADVTAESTATVNSLVIAASIAAAISIGASLVGVGGNSTTDTTGRKVLAYVQNGAALNANGKATVSATATDSVTSNVGTGGLTIAVVGASVGVSISKNTLGDIVSAYIDDATVTSTTSDVDVTARSTTTITGLAVSTALTIAIGAAAIGSNSEATNNVSTQAYITGAAHVTASAGDVNVTAASTPTITASAPGGTAGIVAIGAMFATATLNGATLAYIGEGSTVQAQSVDIEATVFSFDIKATLVVVSVGAIGGLGANVTSNVGHVTEAFIGPEAGSTPTGAATQITATSGPVKVNSSSTHSINANADAGSGSGLIDVSVLLVTTNLGGSTDAYVGGQTTIAASSVDVEADGTTTSTAKAVLVGISATASGGGARVNANDTHDTSGYIDSKAILNVPGGTVNVTATSDATVVANNGGGQGAVFGEIDVLITNANASGDTLAYVEAGASVTAGNLNLNANSTGQSATATSFVIGIGLASGNGCSTTADTSGTVAAYVGFQAGASGSVATTTLLITGSVAILSESNASASSTSQGGGGGAVEVDVLDTYVTMSGDTQAYVGLGSLVTAAQLSVSANTQSRDATVTTYIIGISLGGGNGSNSTATIEGTVEAFIGSQAGAVTTGATTLLITNNITVQANSVTNVNVEVTVGSGGVIAGAAATSDAVVDQTTRAYLSAGTVVGSATLAVGGLSVMATAIDQASDTATVGSGGGVTGRGTNTQAHVTANVLAYIDNNVTANVSGDVFINAESTRAEAHATAKSYGGGLIDVGIPKAEAYATPNVTAYIGSQSVIHSGGDVTVQSYALSQPSGTTYNDDIQGVNGPAGEIVFPSHGLQTGDLVAYDPASSASPIQTPSGPLQNGVSGTERLYKVVVIDDNTLQLGAVFNASSANAGDPLSTGAGFVNVEGVDASRNVIRFFAPHYFETGDAVYYENNGNSDIGGLDDNTTYFVHKIDANTIKLYTTLTAANTAFHNFDPKTQVSGNTFNFNPGFSNGDAVSYQTPAPTLFQSTAVNADYDGNPTGSNYIYVGTHDFQTGDAVVYEANGQAPLGQDPPLNLTPGTTYYVVVRDSVSVQLAASFADAVAMSPTVLTLTPNVIAPVDAINLYLVRPAIGGLSDGVTYYVVNAQAGSFELATAPGGTAITLNAGLLTGITGQHSIGLDGIQLTPASGFQTLRIAFSSPTTTSQTGDELFGPDGVSLRQTNPPAGSGQSSASAAGGSGGGVEVSEPTARVTVSPTVKAWVAAQLINAGDSVAINAGSQGNSSTNGNNGSGGFVDVGDATTSSNFVNTVAAYVGVDNGSGIDATGVQIVAAGAFTLSSDSEFNTSVYTKSDGGGFVAVTHAYGDGNGTSHSDTTVGSNANITANTVAILASGSNMTPTVSTKSRSGGLFGSATADSNITVSSHADIVIGGGTTQITGFQGVDVRAFHTNFSPDRETDAHFSGIGPSHNDGDNNNDLHNKISAGPGATVTAGVRAPGSLSTLQQVSGYNSLALYVNANDFGTISNASEDRNIEWDANVSAFGGGASPTLIVDATGTIVEATNISVYGGSGNENQTSGMIAGSTIIVNPITGAGGTQVLFVADESINNSANNPYPLFDFLQNLANVTIINESALDLEIQGIDVAGGSTPQVTLASGIVNFMFDIAHGSAASSIDIQNLTGNTSVADSNIILSALINNPIGATTIKNTRGNIVSTGQDQIVRTNTLDIEASGSIGTTALRVNVDLVESENLANNTLRTTGLEALAGAVGNIFLNITGRRRDLDTDPFVVYIDSVEAGGTVDLLLQSSVYDPPSGGSGGGVEVIDYAEPSRSGTYYVHFYPDSSPPPDNLDPGVFADTANSTTIASSYQFGQRNLDNSLSGTPGLVAGGNISVIAAHPQTTDPEIAITGITQLTGTTGFIDTTTNGDIAYTEFGGGSMRVGTIQSNNGNVSLTNPDLASVGQDLEVATLISAAGTMLLQIGDNVTTAVGSSLNATTSITLLVDYLSVDPDLGVGSIVNISGGIRSPDTTITGHADNDIFNLNDADNINSGLTLAIVKIDGGLGTNQLKVDDSGDAAARTGTMTFNTVTGLGMGGSGVQYTNMHSLEVDLSQGGTEFTVYSTNSTTPTLVRGGAGGDLINVGSSLAENNGNLNAIQSLLTIIGNGGNDSVFLNDHFNADGPPAVPGNDPALGYNYLITPSGVVNDGTANIGVLPPPRTFAGIVYNASMTTSENTVTFLRLDATDRTNRITVQPNLTTRYFVNGNLPEPGLFRIDGGDFLQLDTSHLINGTGYRQLHITGVGAGFWTFVGPPGSTLYAQEVQFESIERFNHAGDYVTATEANKRSLPIVRVYNDETNQLENQIMAYENKFRGGVRVAVGDVTGDGLPDIVTLPGPGRAMTLRVFSGAPDANGNYTFPLVTEFDVFPSNFRKGGYVAIADFEGDGVNDIIVSTDAGWLPLVGVFKGGASLLSPTTRTMIVPSSPVAGSYLLAFENKFRGGVRVAAGDLNGDNKAEIVVARGKGKTSTVNIFNGGDFAPLQTVFTPYGPKYKRGLNVAVGDFNGDGIRDVIVGAEKGWVSEVVVYSGANVGMPSTPPPVTPVEVSRFMAYDNAYRGGVHVAAETLDGGDPDFGGPVGIWVGPGSSNLRPVRKATFNSATPLLPTIVDEVFEDGYYAGGINVG